MKIALVGAGRIGSTFAYHLARGGHDVTVVARGQRLETLRAENAIVAVDGTNAPVRVAGLLDCEVAYDVALVTVLAHQVDALLPELTASAAKRLVFMFNTFELPDRLRDAVGASRFVAGFPNMTAFFVDGKLKSRVDGPGMVTTLGDEALAGEFKKAGMPTEYEPDMTAFLRSHVAFVVPLMVAAQLTWQRETSLTWAEASKLSHALVEAFDVVEGLGHPLKPGFVAAMAKTPRMMLTGVIWAFSKTAAVKDLGEFGPAETRALIDAMTVAAPGKTERLLSIRP